MFKTSETSKKSDFLDTVIKNVGYTFVFYQHIHFLDWNSMKKEIFKNEQVWRLSQDKHFLSFKG